MQVQGRQAGDNPEVEPISLVADAFYAARQRGPVTDWSAFLQAVPLTDRRQALVELIIIDLQHRWQSEEQPVIEEYVARFPELGPLEAIPDVLIVEEYRCRLRAGQGNDLERIAQRFPTQFARLQPLLEQLACGTMVRASRWPATPTVTPGQPQEVSEQDTQNPTNYANGAIAAGYELIRLLGRGSSGEVWLARKKSSGIDKAIKILSCLVDPTLLRREQRALELIKNLRHPYLLATEDFWVHGQKLYVVMELAEGTLRQRLHACQQTGHNGIPPSELLQYMREAAEALDFLHQQQVVHRDVKPDNILLLHGHVKVADFGLVWRQEQWIGTMRTFAGTPVYMAPEVWLRRGGPASDQYALAITYVELRQGHPPIKPMPLPDLLAAHQQGEFHFSPLLSPAELAVVRRALAIQPQDRFPSCGAFVTTLMAALTESPSNLTQTAAERLSHEPLLQSPSKSPQREAVFSALRTTPPLPHEGIAATTDSAPEDLQGANRSNPIICPAPSPLLTHRQRWRWSTRLLLPFAAITCGIVLLSSLWLSRDRPADPLVKHITDIDEISSNPTTSSSDGAYARPVDGTSGFSSELNEDRSSVMPMQLPYPQARPAPEARLVTLANGQRLPDWIMICLGTEQVRFRLITPWGGPTPVEPFYFQQTKVWNRLYAVGGGTVPAASQIMGDYAPVTHVTAIEAARFAQQAFGGRLPSPQQWDHAAGLYAVRDRVTVSRPGAQVWVDQPRPRSVLPLVSPGDVNEFDLYDLAGNGREWTSALLPDTPHRPARLWDLNHPPADDRAVILRGRNFTLATPLTFDHLRYEQSIPQRQYAGSRSPYTSFRVVLPLNPH